MALTQVDQGLLGTYAQYTGFKNRIINGAMVIDQRNAGASVNNLAANAYCLDRWKYYGDQVSKFSIQQNAGSVTPPAGFSNYLGITSLSAYSVPAGEIYMVRQAIEGFNTSDLNFGTSSASTITLSFWVRSSLTGTFGGVLSNSAQTYVYGFTYSISSANTWTQISVTIAGPTAGTWIGATNGTGLQVLFGLGIGSTYSNTAGAWTTSAGTFYGVTGAVSVVGTNGATWYVTGVQLEKGSTATSFDYRDYGRELMLCQRYFVKWGGETAYEQWGNGISFSTTQVRASANLLVSMRTQPSASASNLRVQDGGAGYAINLGSTATGEYSSKIMTLNLSGASGLTAGRFYFCDFNGTTAGYLYASAEL